MYRLIGVKAGGWGGEGLSDDVWVHNGVGKTGALVYAALNEQEGRTARQVAVSTGVGLRTVERKLQTLESIKAVIKSGSEYTRIPFDRLAAAEALGVAGTGERLRDRHRKEREAWRAHRGEKR